MPNDVPCLYSHEETRLPATVTATSSRIYLDLLLTLTYSVCNYPTHSLKFSSSENECESLSLPYRLSFTHMLLQIVEWAFGKRMTPAERLRKHQRALEKTQRELDRERVKLENQEKKLIVEIKKSAKNGQMGACKIQAKDLVRTRRLVYSERTTERI